MRRCVLLDCVFVPCLLLVMRWLRFVVCRMSLCVACCVFCDYVLRCVFVDCVLLGVCLLLVVVCGSFVAFLLLRVGCWLLVVRWCCKLLLLFVCCWLLCAG